tara:strand:- start:53 stop:604 length:552 start_codon:yes stop_codon:yes gene_type:complete
MKKFLGVIFGISLFATPTLSLANEIDEHKYLIKSLQNVGVQVKFNTSLCNPEFMGAYYNDNKGNSIVLVCQDKSKFKNGLEFDVYNENDLDTLRHEAHHVVQDCVNGKLGDNKTGRLFTGELFQQYIIDNITSKQKDYIYKIYHEGGASDDEILHEIEAFVVARDVNAIVIADKITELCSFQS